MFFHIVGFNMDKPIEGHNCIFLMQLQMALHHSIRGIMVLITETSSHLKKKNYNNLYIHFNHKCSSCANSAHPQLHVLRNSVGKVTRDVGGSIDPVFTM